MKRSKTLDKLLKNKPWYDYYEYEWDNGEWSIWIYLKAGWINDYTDCISIHEWTVKDCISNFSDIRKMTDEELLDEFGTTNKDKISYD